MAHLSDDTEKLLERAASGDAAAKGELLVRHQARLRRMVALRLDARVARRIDPSDVVQDALIDAHAKLPAYLESRPLPFYPWLRRIAWERLVKLHLRHVEAAKRSVRREESPGLRLPDRSAVTLAQRLVAGQASPSRHLEQKEALARMRAALERLSQSDREVLVLRHLEELSVAEVAAVLEINEGAVKLRRLRALQRLQKVFDQSGGDP